MREHRPEEETRFKNYESEYTRYYDPTRWKKGKDGSLTFYTHIGVWDVDDFMKHNPNCCKAVGLKGEPFVFPSLLTRLFGGYADVIEVRYTARFLDKKGNIVALPDYKEYPVIRNCGYVHTTPAL